MKSCVQAVPKNIYSLYPPQPMRSLPRRLSLPTILIVPFVVQISLAVGIIGYLSYKNGQETVNNIAYQQREAIAARILQQLKTTVEKPHFINQINANSLIQGDFDFVTGKGEYRFLQQAKIFPVTNLIYCGTEKDGAFLGAGRSKGGIAKELNIQTSNVNTNNLVTTYNVDENGKRSSLREKPTRKYDPRLRPWYEAAKAEGKATWSQIYLDFDTSLPTITASKPVYNPESRQLLGVCATDIIFSEEMSRFLKSLDISKSGIAFITEPSGLIIASSTPDATITGTGENTRLLTTKESSNALIREAGQVITNRFREFGNERLTELSFDIKGEKYYLEVVRFQDSYGLDWTITIVVPESDFMGRINIHNQTTILLSLVALMVAIALGILTTRWIVGLILQLRNASQAIAQGDLNQSVEISGINELEDLSQVFNQMAGQLKTSFENKEQLVQERTKELSQALTDLQTTQQELVQSEKMAALGQLVAGIAHEINTPLGAIRASISNITSGLESALAQLPQVLQKLSLPQQTEFNALLNAACQPHPYLSTRETRKLKRTLAQELATYNIENPEALADTLVQMGITENLMQFLPLFQNEHGDLVLETANNLSSQFRNSENINLAVDRAAKIIYALKSYARQDTSGSKIMAKITDNIDIVLTLYHNQIKQKIELIQNYQPVPDILCYPEELSQVWTNLIHNAIQAMNYKGVLKINVFQQEQFVVVQIVDSGMGIPLEIQEKIFEPFFTTKPAGEGSGLGLDIVSKIIKKHDGSIEVASQPGETTFSIYLPID